MAGKITDEILRFQLIVNGNEAQAEILKQEKANKGLADEIKRVTAEQKKLDQQRKEQEKGINSLADKIDAIKEKIRINEQASIFEIKVLKERQNRFQEGTKDFETYGKKIDSARESLQRGNAKYVEQMVALQAKQSGMISNYTETSNKSAELGRQIEKLSSSVKSNDAEILRQINSMKLSELTMEQLRVKAEALTQAMNRKDIKAEELKRVHAELVEVEGQMGKLKKGAQESGGSLSNFADKFNQYSGMAAAAVAAFTGVALSIQQTIDMNNKLADAQTAVAKTTGLSNEEVKQLGESFGEFNTRTSRMDLFKIAEVGGRLGVPKEEIKSFTQEVDKMYVALGDGFEGGAEQVANQMGKIKGLFKETRDLDMATAFNQIGSGMNELGAAGAASEANIADFTLRVGTLPESLKPTVAETMALGAAFEESGIDAERAGTAYSNFISTAANNTDKFAQVMRISNQEVKDLINKDPMQFFLKFAEGAKGLNAVDMANMLDKLKLNDQYVKSIIGAAAENTDKFRKSIELSNQAVTEATSLNEEFQKVNENSAAIFEKVRNSFIGMFTSETVANTLNYLIAAFGKLIGAVEDTEGAWSGLGKYILFLTKLTVVATVAIVSYNAAVTLSSLTMATLKEKLLAYTVIQKINNALNTSGTFIQNLYTVSIARAQIAYAILTRNTELQSAAQSKLNLITKANPWALVIALVSAAVVAYIAFNDELSQSEQIQKTLNEAKAEGAEKVAQEKAELDSLLAVARDETLSKEQRLDAIKRLNAISPEYLGQLSLENIKTREATDAVRAYVKALDEKAYAEALQAKKVEKYKALIELENKGPEAFVPFGSKLVYQASSFFSRTSKDGENKNHKFDATQYLGMSKKDQEQYYLNSDNTVRAIIVNFAKQYNTVQQEIKSINEKQKSLAGKGVKTVSTGGGDSDYDTTPDPKKTKRPHTPKPKKDPEVTKFENEKKSMLSEHEKAVELAQELEENTNEAKAEITKDWYLRERLEIVNEGQEKLNDLEKKRIGKDEFDKLDNIIARTKGAEKAQFMAIKEQWLDNNKTLDKVKVDYQKVTDYKLQALEEKRIAEQLQKDEENFQKLLVQDKQQTDLVLANMQSVEDQKAFLQDKVGVDRLQKITTWEEGKAAIEEYFQSKSLQRQEEYLRKMIEQLESLPTASLTPDQVKVLEDMRLKLVEILGVKQQLAQSQMAETSVENRLSGLGGGNVDLLGLNPDQWKAIFTKTNDLKENMLKVGAAIMVAKNMFGIYSDFVKANEEQMLRKMEVASERKKRKLKDELDTGLINQEAYKKLTLEHEAEIDKKKAKIELQAARRQRMMTIASIISSTALAVVGALGNKPWTPFNFALAAGVGALGAVQLALALAQPMPQVTGAEDGFYPVMRQQDGKMFNARHQPLSSGIYDQPTVLVGEAGKNFPELVIDGRTMKRINPRVMNEMNQEIARVNGFEDGMYPNAAGNGTDPIVYEVLEYLKKNNELLESLQRDGVVGVFDRGPETGKVFRDSIKSYEDLRNKNKHG